MRVVKHYFRNEGWRTGLLVDEDCDHDTMLVSTGAGLEERRITPMDWKELPGKLDAALAFYRSRGYQLPKEAI